ncbi:MAG: ATP-dependent DNA ligase, partial [Planctomycetota bacterium]
MHTTTISVADFIAHHRSIATKPTADIRSRWTSRIVARGLHTQGRAGASTYLRDYGRGISSAKVISLAVMAEAENCHDMAAEFWSAAYTLETGDVPPRTTVALQSNTPTASSTSLVAGLPSHLQPASIITMQPIDAGRPQAEYIADPAYIGQPKRDGNRIVIIATPDAVFYQSRSTSTVASPGAAFDQAFKKAAVDSG